MRRYSAKPQGNEAHLYRKFYVFACVWPYGQISSLAPTVPYPAAQLRMWHTCQTGRDFDNDIGWLRQANPTTAQRGRSSSYLGKQNHQTDISHSIRFHLGSGQTVLRQQEEELMAKQAIRQSWLGALRFGTEKQTRHVKILEIQTELGFLRHQSASRAIFGKLIAGQKMSQLRQTGNGITSSSLFWRG